ncbi:MAG: tetratricopeptide repeat protein [Spirochaetales bacterium]|nr:tetratricopeptide repeat protein [Spirochaetales bacterium]
MKRVSSLVLLPIALLAVSCVGNVNVRLIAEEYFNLGNIYFELGEYEISFEYYQRAIALTDEVPGAGYNLARLHERRDEFDEALAVLDELLADDPENGLYRETRAYVLFRAGRSDEARALYADLIEDHPARVRVRYNLAVFELSDERPREALEVLDGGIDFARDDAEYRWLAAEAAYLSEDEARAVRELELFRSLSEDDNERLGRLARRQAEWGFRLAALELLTAVPELAEEDASLRFLEARLYLLDTPEFDRGVGALELALDNGFDDSDAIAELIEQLSEDEQEIIEALIAERSGESDDAQLSDDTESPDEEESEE